jgi:hypothetical protein
MMQNDGAGFLSGASGGFFGSLGATAWGGANGKWKGIAGKYAGSDVGTIAFGALSGGVGAELSGGNFWQGAIAGGIVAGLNDVMHKGFNKIVMRANLISRLQTAKIDPYAYANLSDSELASFAQKVLPELFTEANCPVFESRESLTDGKGNSAEGLTVGGEFYKDQPGGFISKIQLAKSAFSSYLNLASIMGHELNHAADYFNGNMTRWYNKGGLGYAKSMTENKAYSWQFNMPGAPVNLKAFSSYNNQVNLWDKLFNGFK